MPNRFKAIYFIFLMLKLVLFTWLIIKFVNIWHLSTLFRKYKFGVSNHCRWHLGLRCSTQTSTAMEAFVLTFLKNNGAQHLPFPRFDITCFRWHLITFHMACLLSIEKLNVYLHYHGVPVVPLWSLALILLYYFKIAACRNCELCVF